MEGFEAARERGDGAARSPFGAHTRLRGLLGLALLGTLTVGIVLGVLGVEGEDPVFTSVAFALGFYGPLLWWLRREVARAGTSLGAYVGPLPRERALGTWSLLVLSLFGLALAELTLGGAAVRALDESLFQDWFAEAAEPARPYGTPARWLAWIPGAFVFVVAAPVVEELVFRGLLVDVFEARWGRARAWLASATLFGLLHAPVVLHTILFALVLSAVRTASGSLALPIALHAANNLLPAILTSLALASDGQIPASDGTLPGGVGTGLVLLVLCLPLPLRVLARGWRAGSRAP
jgi:CAAX protease family protein